MHGSSRVTCVPRSRRDDAPSGQTYMAVGVLDFERHLCEDCTGTTYCFNLRIAGRIDTFFCSFIHTCLIRHRKHLTYTDLPTGTMHITSTILVAALASLAHAQQAATPKGFSPSVNTKLDVTFNSTSVKTPGELLSKASTSYLPPLNP
jgi:hypothetical protein